MSTNPNRVVTGQAWPVVNGERIDPITTNRFRVAIYGGMAPVRLGFSGISGLGSEIETMEVHQGTSPIVMHTPTGIKYDDVTFEFGVTGYNEALSVMNWYNDTVALLFSTDAQRLEAKSKKDKEKEEEKKVEPERQLSSRDNPHLLPTRSVVITMPMNKPRAIMAMILKDAWPTKAKFGDLNANDSEVWIYSLTLKYSGIQMHPFTSFTRAATPAVSG